MHDFWKIYDCFRLMDKRGCGLVRRSDFYEATTDYVTLDMRRAIARANLHQRFRSNASEMTLQELVQLIWPNVNEADKEQMSNWAKLRDAWSTLSASDFEGTRQDLKVVFDLLNIEGDDMLSISDLVRSRILTKVESQNLLREWYKVFKKAPDDSGSESGSEVANNENRCLSFNEFCQMTQKHLTDKYVQKDDENLSWEKPCRSAFENSKIAVAKLMTARENYEFASNKEEASVRSAR
jgi:Ca2+-binding EF-hand superfamily protein